MQEVESQTSPDLFGVITLCGGWHHYLRLAAALVGIPIFNLVIYSLLGTRGECLYSQRAVRDLSKVASLETNMLNLDRRADVVNDEVTTLPL